MKFLLEEIRELNGQMANCVTATNAVTAAIDDVIDNIKRNHDVIRREGNIKKRESLISMTESYDRAEPVLRRGPIKDRKVIIFQNKGNFDIAIGNRDLRFRSGLIIRPGEKLRMYVGSDIELYSVTDRDASELLIWELA